MLTLLYLHLEPAVYYVVLSIGIISNINMSIKFVINTVSSQQCCIQITQHISCNIAMCKGGDNIIKFVFYSVLYRSLYKHLGISSEIFHVYGVGRSVAFFSSSEIAPIFRFLLDHSTNYP